MHSLQNFQAPTLASVPFINNNRIPAIAIHQFHRSTCHPRHYFQLTPKPQNLFLLKKPRRDAIVLTGARLAETKRKSLFSFHCL
ncbi:hypothetical protein AB0758_45600 [Tolypothrix bouteillei VB521301_2]|uniref:hypothetical protein n=1 Tax=Tolypothrix bouteillei TaxID=1246981 RepID=UPI0038B46628